MASGSMVDGITMPVPGLRAVILHKHILFRDLIELELCELGPVDVVGSTHDRQVALDLVRSHQANALVLEAADGFIDRSAMLNIFCVGAETTPHFVLIAANLTTSEIEVLQATVSYRPHLGDIRPLLTRTG